ncbi:MAG: NAD(P)-binding protein [Gammaproteobacteria bacterium]|nr:NAD(P)-binding protein [Gammaproteobacteria bacterium]
MTAPRPEAPSVAIVGAGLSGATCAAALQRAGFRVTVFDKSRGVGGRMASRRVRWTSDAGEAHVAALDHGTHHFLAEQPRFRSMIASAEAAGCVESWRPEVHSVWPGAAPLGFVAVPCMPALCKHVLAGLPVRPLQQVMRLRRDAEGWHLQMLEGDSAGPFDQVVLALPAPQAASLIASHADGWAETLAAVPMASCWTLMAVTDDVDWPWDAAVPPNDPLAWVSRNDRKPGRDALPGFATWVAHASAEWSASHLEDDPQQVEAELRAALSTLIPNAQQVQWHHAGVHRWRYAAPLHGGLDERGCWWDARLGVGLCGDFFGNGTVEAAWHSGDELADTMVAEIEAGGEFTLPFLDLVR